MATNRPPGIDTQWFAADSPRRTSAFVARLVVGFGVLLIVVTIAAGTFVRGEISRSELQDDIAFGSVVALTPAEAIPSLVQAAEREALIVSAGGVVENVLLVDSATDARFARWRVRVADTSASSERVFLSVDPNGETWRHVVGQMFDGGRLVTSRPTSDIAAASRRVVEVVALALIAELIALGAVWMMLFRRVAQPLTRVVTAGMDLRLRGRIRESTRRSMATSESAPAEFRQIARLFDEIEIEDVRGRARVESLLAASTALGRSLDQSTVLQRTLDQLHQLLGVDRSMIQTVDPRGGVSTVIASRGHAEEYAEDFLREAPDATLPSRRALAQQEPVQIPDTESEVVSEGIRERARRHDFRSVLAVPLTADLEHPTVLTIYSSEPRIFSFDEIALSKSFASIAGAAIRNAELFARTDESLRQQTSRLDAIVESVDQGILVESVRGDVLFANAKMFDLLPAEVAGQLHVGDSSEHFLGQIASRCADPERTIDELLALRPEHESWVDIEFRSGSRIHDYRVRAFKVVDSRGADLGQGMVWTDTTQDRELERMKSGLLATVSHEFRTPLALIKGYATTLLAEDVTWDPTEEKEFLTMVSVEADRLTALVQRLLDMRRIDAGMLALQLLPTELGVIVGAALDALPHQRGRIRVGPLPDVAVSIDAARVVTVLRNLLENACKYSPEDAPVDLSVAEVDDTIHFAIRDYGPGVSPVMRERIFETFVRGDSALDAEHSGIGLGLAIARGFVEAHGGRIWLETPKPGPGSTFVFTLPTVMEAQIAPSTDPAQVQP